MKAAPPMFRFTIRELVLLTIIVAMGVGWWVEHRKYNTMAIAANNQETALHLLISYLVEKDDWKITTTEGHMEVSLPGDKPGQKSFSSTWTHPRPQIGPLEPFTKVWSRDTMRAEDEAIWGEKRTMPWEEGYGD